MDGHFEGFSTAQSQGPAILPLASWTLEALNFRGDATFLKDVEGRYLYINDAGARMLGRPASEIVGKTDLAAFSEGSALLMMDRDRQILSNKKPWTYESVAVVGGETRVYLSTKMPCTDSSGKLLGLLGLSQDVTSTHEIKLRLARAEKALADQEGSIHRLLGTFKQCLSEVSHEFKNSVTVVVLKSHLAERILRRLGPEDFQKVSESVQKMLQQNIEHSTELCALIDSIVLKYRASLDELQLGAC